MRRLRSVPALVSVADIHTGPGFPADFAEQSQGLTILLTYPAFIDPHRRYAPQAVLLQLTAAM